MIHVTDELELYSLGALAPGDAARVTAHLSECPACREQARAIDEVVQELPETLPGREAPGRLRDRILASARAELTAVRAPRRDTAWTARWLRPALALAAVQAQLSDAQRERGIDNATQAAINIRMGKHLDAWLKLDERGKQEYVRKLIQQNPNRPPPGPGERPGMRGGRQMTPAQVKRFIENTSPDRRAAMAEFMGALRKARQGGSR